MIVAGGVRFLPYTIWTLRLPAWLAGRPERYQPRHRNGLADTDSRRLLPPPEDVPRPGEVRTRGTGFRTSGSEAGTGPGHSCPICGTAADGPVCGRCGYGYGYQPRPASDAAEAMVTAVLAPGELERTDPVPIDDTVTDWNSARLTGAARRVTRQTIWQPPGGWAHAAAAALADEYWPKAIEAAS